MIQPRSALDRITSSAPNCSAACIVWAAYVRNPPVECTKPLGLPVDPDVYMTNSGCSLPTGSHSRTPPPCIVSRSSSASMRTCATSPVDAALPPPYTTSLAPDEPLLMDAHSDSGCDALAMSSFEPESDMRSCSAAALRPENTTLCGAPSRAHASIATTASMLVRIHSVTTSPLRTPSSRSTPAAHCAWCCSSE